MPFECEIAWNFRATYGAVYISVLPLKKNYSGKWVVNRQFYPKNLFVFTDFSTLVDMLFQHASSAGHYRFSQLVLNDILYTLYKGLYVLSIFPIILRFIDNYLGKLEIH